MSQQTINIGSAANDGTGDPLRTSFTKCNDNFTELYAARATPSQGRLTLQTLTPVMTTTQSAKTTLFWTPYVGNKVCLFDGSTMAMTTFAELSNVTTASSVGNAGPAAVAASSCYDLFVWSNAGTPTLTRGPAWTNDTTRSAGTALVMVAGILLNNVAITNGPAASRGTYVGTVRSNASSQLDWILGAAAVGGTAGDLAVWNCYNRVMVTSVTQDTTASFSVSSNPQNWMGSANNRCSFVCGLVEDAFDVVAIGTMAAGGGASCIMGIALDTNGASAVYVGQAGFTSVSTGSVPLMATHTITTLGYHFCQMLNGAFTANATSLGSTLGAQLSSLRFTGRM